MEFSLHHMGKKFSYSFSTIWGLGGCRGTRASKMVPFEGYLEERKNSWRKWCRKLGLGGEMWNRKVLFLRDLESGLIKKKKKKKKKRFVWSIGGGGGMSVWWVGGLGWWLTVGWVWFVVRDCGGPFLGEGCVLWEDEAFAFIQHVYQPLCTLTHPHPPSLPTHTHPQLGVIDNNCM